MSGPDPKSLVVVGAIAGAHGVRGDVKIKSFTADPETLFDFDQLLDGDGAPLLEVQSYRPAKAVFVVTPTSKRSREDWEMLKGTRLYVPRTALPAAEEDEFYFDDLVGLRAVAPDGGPLGRVKAIQNYGAGDLLEIQPSAGGKSVLVPFTETDVPALSLAEGHLTIANWAVWAGTEET